MKRLASTLLLIIVVILSFILGSYTVTSEYPLISGDVTRSLPAEDREHMLFAVPWFKDAVGCRVGDLHLLAPNVTQPESYFIYSKGRFILLDEGEGVLGLGIRSGLTKGGGSNGVSMFDKRKDGTFSHLAYEIIDSEGDVIGTAVDRDRDGQLDDKLMFVDDPYAELWVENGWYVQESRSGQMVVSVAGQWVPVITRHGKHYFVDSFSKQHNEDTNSIAPPPDH